ncbi:MAG: hypothetical protein ACREDR_28135 [Blastocatellia bacterium]
MPVYAFSASFAPGKGQLISDLFKQEVEKFNREHRNARVQSTSLTNVTFQGAESGKVTISAGAVVLGLIAYEE